MTEFTVHLSNRPGQFAALVGQLATAGVHIEALALFAHGDEGMARLMANDDDVARRVLSEAGVRFEEQRVIETVIRDDPQALAEMTKKLADSGVNIEAMYLLHANGDSLHFAVAVDDHAIASTQLQG
ncbi:MAG: hypothetical protein QNJ75_04365 [Acidimicrobiia bacterium]|nr:hypothetical protein [Acidimicrobiia bacterium]